jgi:hypothetical protein
MLPGIKKCSERIPVGNSSIIRHVQLFRQCNKNTSENQKKTQKFDLNFKVPLDNMEI